LLVLTVALCSCAGSQPGGTPADTALLAQLPPLPDAKAPSELSGDVVEGNETWNSSFNAVPIETDLELSSGVNTMCWGIWRLQPGEDELLGVEIQLSVSGDDEAWAAVANYELGRWEFEGPLTAGQELPLSNVAHRSESGNCFVAVMTSGGNNATVNRLVMTENRVGWQIVTVGREGLCVQSSLAVIDGRPAISYYDDSSADSLKFIRSSTATGADPEDWGDPTTVYTGWIAYSDLAEVEGTPAVCFWLQGTLVYSRSATVDGDDPLDWSVASVDNDDNAGHYCSLAVVAGNPAISYHNNPDFNVKNLRYARSTTSTGENSGDWSQKVEIDTGGEVGLYTSLAVVDGNPAIAYADLTDKQLKYARSTTETGADQADWSQIVVVDTGEAGLGYMSLAVVDGNPAISYWDHKTDDLKYARSLTATGADAGDWLQQAIVHSETEPSSADNYTSLLVVDGKPAIAYPSGEFTTNLSFAHASTTTGGDSADWDAKDIVDSETGVGTYCDMVLVGGRPAITYYDESNFTTKYAILYR